MIDEHQKAAVTRPIGAKVAKVGGVVLALGVLPLLLYALLGPSNGNPIGLGLLAALAMPVGGAALLIGVSLMLVERSQERRR